MCFQRFFISLYINISKGNIIICDILCTNKRTLHNNLSQWNFIACLGKQKGMSEIFSIKVNLVEKESRISLYIYSLELQNCMKKKAYLLINYTFILFRRKTVYFHFLNECIFVQVPKFKSTLKTMPLNVGKFIKGIEISYVDWNIFIKCKFEKLFFGVLMSV